MAKTPEFRRLILAHELFHCFQFDIRRPDWSPLPAWIGEGSADWAALTVDSVPYSVGGGNLTTHIGSPHTPIFERSYDAVGFWGHVQDVEGSLWDRLPKIFKDGRVLAKPGAPLLHIATQGYGRLSPVANYVQPSDLKEAWFCTDPEGCTCPPNTTGEIPSHHPLSPKTYLSLAGDPSDVAGSFADLTSNSLDTFCHPKSKPTPYHHGNAGSGGDRTRPRSTERSTTSRRTRSSPGRPARDASPEPSPGSAPAASPRCGGDHRRLRARWPALGELVRRRERLRTCRARRTRAAPAAAFSGCASRLILGPRPKTNREAGRRPRSAIGRPWSASGCTVGRVT